MTPAPMWKATKPRSEGAEIDRARDRDSNRCRLVPWCHISPVEMAHVDARGMGGDHSIRTTSDNLVGACHPHHQGGWSLHSGHLRVKKLTPKGCDGPIEVYAREVLEDDAWYLLLRESAPHKRIYEYQP